MTPNDSSATPLGPFGATEPQGGMLPGSHFPVPARHGRQLGEMNTLATLSVVFAFVFAPVGVVMGHLALSQIKHLGQRGRDRALIGLTLSYVFILFMIVALVVWALTDDSGESSKVASPTATTAPRPLPPAAMPPVTTVLTPAPTARRTASVEDLRVGQCVEIQQTAPDPTDPGAQQIKIFPVSCQTRDGVFRVDRVSASTSACTDEYLMNQNRNLFACISKFGGGV